MDSVTTECPCGAAGTEEEVFEICPPATRSGEGRSSGPVIESDSLPLVAAAHEFKTPLVVMLGYADLLYRGELGPITDRQGEILREMRQGAERLQRVVQNLLLLYELRASKAQQPEPESLPVTDVNESMDQLFRDWKSAAKLKDIQYRLFPAEGSPGVAIEPLRLQHIVSNLIENAINYTPKGGYVGIHVMSCFWDMRKAQTQSLFGARREKNIRIENAVCISVRDTGPGIAAQHHQEIFGDFVQLKRTSNRGTGLGLAIARRLVEAHRGAIWVESEPGRGSEFKVLLPQVRKKKY